MSSASEHVAALGAAVNRLTSGTSGITFTSATDEDGDEFDFLTLPELDEDYLDDVHFEDDSRQVLPHIPFISIHNELSLSRRCFLPAQKIHVKITGVERSDHSTIFNRYVYVIQLKHGDFEWTLRRQYKHFHLLHSALMLSRAKLSIPLPSREHRRHQQQRRRYIERNQHLPHFPRRPDALVRQENIIKRQRSLESYLQLVLRCAQFRKNAELLRFLEVSRLSFVSQLGRKQLEGLVRKRSGGRRFPTICCNPCVCAARWHKRWLLVKDTFVAYLHPKDGRLCDVILMDKDFSVTCDRSKTGVSHGLLISNLTRHLVVDCGTAQQASAWQKCISEAAETTGDDFTQSNPHGSFAPQRQNNYVTWFIDAASYMSEAADAMETAKEEIFIADWWLSPEVYMKRPIVEGEKWRLDKILQRKADAGVKIFILLYKEMELALGINSYYTKQTLLKLHHSNIKVLRHPDGINYWTHHEKCIVIDQRIAFLGGIDLCYGRWDTTSHRLTDLGSLGTNGKNEVDTEKIKENVQSRAAQYREDAERHCDVTTSHHVDIVKMEDSAEDEHSTESSRLTGSGDAHQQQQQQSHHARLLPSQSTPTPHLWKTDIQPRSIASIPRLSVGNRLAQMGVTHERLRRTGSTGSGMDASVALELSSESRLALSEQQRAGLAQSVLCSCVVLRQETLQKHDTAPCAACRPARNSLRAIGRSTAVHGSMDSLTDSSSVNGSQAITDRTTGDTVTSGSVQVTTDVTGDTRGEMAHSPSEVTIIVTPDKEEMCNVTAAEVTSSLVTSAAMTSAIVTSAAAAVTHNTSSQSSTVVTVHDTETSSGEAVQHSTCLRPVSRHDSHRISSCFTDDEPRLFLDYLRDMPASPEVTPDLQGGGLVSLNNNIACYIAQKSISLNAPQKRKFWKRRSVSVEDGSTSSQLPITAQKDGDSNYLSATNNNNFPKPTTPIPTRAQAFRYALRRDWRERIHRRQMRSLDITTDASLHEQERIVFSSGEVEPPSPMDLLEVLDLKGSTKLWVGKDYANFIYKDFVHLDKPFTDFIDRLVTPRMPWHDIGTVLFGCAARDVARHFIQRWNFAKLQKRKTNGDYPLLLPKSYARSHVPDYIIKAAFYCNCQVLRSVSPWSAGISHIESSIHDAYLHLIENAKHYIYIENQFFISTAVKDEIENEIAIALYHRILKAHRAGEKFRVYVVMPLLPAFEGQLGTATGAAIQAVLHWNYQSICRGGHSLLELLTAHIPDPFEYVSFYGLRTHDQLLDNLTTELIYVHSKLMIVDDNKVIAGSANINDRSMLGRRDSELATLVEDTQTFSSRMAGQPYDAGCHAGSLRYALFREHLGLNSDDSQVIDPVCTEFYKGVWMKQASINTAIFEKVFRCIPTDDVTSFAGLHQYQKLPSLAQTNPDKARLLLQRVKGYLVLLPLKFLCNDNLVPAMGTKAGFAPGVIWM